jgi:uncharacterized protein
MVRTIHLIGLMGALLLPLWACSACRSQDSADSDHRPLKVLTVHGKDHLDITIEVEIVASSRARQRGLMFRDNLADGQGMLFLFESEEEHPFWMKNTLIPLDIIYIDSKRQVVGIVHNAEPRNEQSLTVGLPSRFVLEVPGGYCNRVGIHRGDTVAFTL